MKTNILLLLLLSLTFFFGCDEPIQPIGNPTDEDSIDAETDTLGTIAFYTNAQQYLFCDTITVDIYIDGSRLGTLKQSSMIDSTNDLSMSDSTVIARLDAGIYDYYAVSNCGDSICWKGEITVNVDSTQLIFLDVWDVADTITQTHMKLIGTWEDYRYCDGCWIVQFTKDSVIEDYSRYGIYNVISNDSIEAIRPELNEAYSKHKIVFFGNDTLRLYKFTRVTTGISNYDNRYLKRIE